MKPQIPWLRVFVEGVVIVGSILLAFGIEAWWDERQERADEQLTLAALQVEFLGAKAELDYRRELHGRIEEGVKFTVAALQGARHRNVSSIPLSHAVLALAYIPPTTQLSLGTLTGLIQSGQLGILQEPELRTALSGWATFLDEMTEEETRALDFVQSQLDPVLRSRVDVTPFVNMEFVRAFLDGTVSQVEAARESLVPADLETMGVFAVRLSIIQHLLEEFPPLQNEVDRILGLIEESLQR